MKWIGTHLLWPTQWVLSHSWRNTKLIGWELPPVISRIFSTHWMTTWIISSSFSQRKLFAAVEETSQDASLCVQAALLDVRKCGVFIDWVSSLFSHQPHSIFPSGTRIWETSSWFKNWLRSRKRKLKILTCMWKLLFSVMTIIVDLKINCTSPIMRTAFDMLSYKCWNKLAFPPDMENISAFFYIPWIGI